MAVMDSVKHNLTLLPEKLLAFMNTGIKLRDFAIAIIVLLILVLIVYVIMYGYRVRYPRPFFLFHSMTLTKTMGDTYNDINLLYHRIEKTSALGPPASLPLTMEFIRQMIEVQEPSKVKGYIGTKALPLGSCDGNDVPSECIGSDGNVDPNMKDANGKAMPVCGAGANIPKGTPHDGTNETKFEAYLSHDHIMNNKVDRFIFYRILKHFRKYSACGTDNDAGVKAIEDCIKDVEAVKAELEAAMPILDAFEKEFPADQAVTWVDYCVSVRKLHFYFHHGSDELKEMYDIRRFSLFNFLVVLMRPYVDKIIIKEIYMRWVDAFSMKSINKSHADFRDWWTWLGEGSKGSSWPGIKPGKMLQAVIRFTENLLSGA